MTRNKQIALIYLLLTAITLTAFWQLYQCDFTNYDDPAYVTENANIRHGITVNAIRWALTTGYASNWHPLTWMSHMLDVQLFGLNPQWHHQTNLLFHIANTLLLFFVFHRMTKAPWKSALVAALFAVHPLHVESVAWVAERKDVLSTFFWMLTMAAYIYYVEHRTENAGQEARSRKQEAGSEKHRARGKERTGIFRFPSSGFHYSAVLILFALGLMAKPMLVTLPFVLLLLDYWPLQRMWGLGGQGSREQGARSEKQNSGLEQEPRSANKRKRKSAKKPAKQDITQSSALRTQSSVLSPQSFALRPLFLEKLPLFALSVLSCTITFIAHQKGGAVTSEVFPLGVRIANALVSYIIYIQKTIWPNELAVFYPHPGLRPLWEVFGAVLLLTAVTVLVIRTAKRLPYLAVGWLWFASTLVPVIGIVQVGKQAMADRYSYIPLIGLFIIVAWLIPEFLKKWQPTQPARKQALFASLSALILAILCVAAWVQVGYWHNSITLYDHALEVTGPNVIVNYNRGVTHFELGHYRQAILDFDKIVELDPGDGEAYYNRGVAYANLGSTQRAIEDLKTAARFDCEGAKSFLRSRGINWRQEQ